MRLKTILPGLTLVAALISCATTSPTRFYTLTLAQTPMSASQNEKAEASTQLPILIDVAPVSVPERLRRPQLVINTKDSAQLKILEQDRWASSFNEELRDSFAIAIASHIHGRNITRAKKRSNDPFYQVVVALNEYSATPGGDVQASFGWTITYVDHAIRSEGQARLTCDTTVIKPAGNMIETLVKASQEAVMDAAVEIADALDSISKNNQTSCRSAK